MRTFELLILYGAVGVLAAGALLAVARGRMSDAALLFAFWPLYGPFLLLGRSQSDRPALASLVVGEEAVRALEARLEKAQDKVREIDTLLQRNDFSVAEAKTRYDELADRGDERAAASAKARLENIHRLVRLRERFERELTEIDELMAQLRVQSEVVRIAGGADDGTSELVHEIGCRVEVLDSLLAE